MSKPLDPAAERQRLQALYDLGVLDTPADPAIERICRLVEQVFTCNTVLVSLVDECRQWFKRRSGVICDEETPRAWAFCDYTIRGDEIFEVLDARTDPRFQANPLVTQGPQIVYYAGAPLRLSGGASPGSLCLIDDRPRPALTAAQRAMLTDFAALVSRELEVTRALRGALANLGRHAAID